MIKCNLARSLGKTFKPGLFITFLMLNLAISYPAIAPAAEKDCDKTEVCHVETNDTVIADDDSYNSLCLSGNALSKHLEHGDYEGPCEASDSS